jgi:hypothetical protein
MMTRKRAWRGLHWPSLFLMLGLCTFGVMVIYSATHTSEAADLRNAAIQQSAWVGLGLVCFLVFAFADYHRWVNQGWFWFGGGLLLLLIVLVFGREVNRGEKLGSDRTRRIPTGGGHETGFSGGSLRFVGFLSGKNGEVSDGSGLGRFGVNSRFSNFAAT